MKKRYKFIILIVTLAISFSSIFSFLLVKNITNNYTIFHFNQKTLEYIFGEEVSSAEDFCKNKGAGTILYKKYTYAKANNGILTLIVDTETLKLWKSSNWTLQILESLLEESGKSIDVNIDWSEDFLNAKHAVKKSGIEISQDYSLITQGPGDDGSFFTFLLPACVYMQIFEGKQVDEIKVTYIEIDEQGNILDEIKWEINPSDKL